MHVLITDLLAIVERTKSHHDSDSRWARIFLGGVLCLFRLEELPVVVDLVRRRRRELISLTLLFIADLFDGDNEAGSSLRLFLLLRGVEGQNLTFS